MSEGEVLVSGGERSETGSEILDELPAWMPRDESKGNFKLLDAAGRGFDRLKDDISDADDATNVQTAQSIGQLQELAKLVQLESKNDEPIEKYRKRVVGEFQTTTSEGTLDNLFTNVATLLSINKSRIEYTDGSENGAILLTVPGSAIDSVSLTKGEFASILGKHTAAGFRADVKAQGTFTYITPTQYTNGDHNATRGYDGLNSNGSPKDNGGTYAGLLN